MPVLNAALEPVWPLDVFHANYFAQPYEFSVQAEKLRNQFSDIERPIGYASFLQQVHKPVWHIEYVPELFCGPFRVGMLGALERIGAQVLFHPKTDLIYCKERDIRLTWHSCAVDKNLWNYKESAVPRFILCDRTGYSGWSELAEVSRDTIDAIDDASANAFYEDTVKPIIASKITKYAQEKTDEFSHSDFLFVPLQLENDSVSRHLYFGNYAETAGLIMERLLREGHRVVVKRHPYCLSTAIPTMIARLERYGLIQTTADIHDILPRARAVVTMNSGVGFESLLHLKKVISFGKSEYSVCTTTIRNHDDVSRISDAVGTPPDTQFIKKYLFHSLGHCFVDTTSPASFDRHVLRMICESFLGTKTGAFIR